MGYQSQRPPLPAPTESGVGDNAAPRPPTLDDTATNISIRSDITSYSIPDNGDPITIPTGKKSKGSATSQASLLIEYFEGGKSGDKAGRPSVRVKVTPSGKARHAGDAVHITEVGNNRKISHTRRISLGTNTTDSKFGPAISDLSQEDEARSRPIEVEILPNHSDMSSNASRSRALPLTSDVSSMPGDSVLDRPLGFKEHARSVTTDMSEADSRAGAESTIDAIPVIRRRRSRSHSRERIERRAAEKARVLEHSPDEASKRRLRKSKDRTSSGRSEGDRPSHSRRSSKTHSSRDSADYRSGTKSSIARPPREVDSNLSTLSKSSLANNPRLLQTVEDAIRRMILPEINEIKRQQSVNQSSSRRDRDRGVRDSLITETTFRTDSGDRRLSQSSSEPYIRDRVGKTRDIEVADDSLKLKKTRHSSKEGGDGETRSRRTSESSSRRDREERTKTKESSRDVRDRDRQDRDKTKASSTRRSSKESRDSGSLTTAALRSHDRTHDARSSDRERRERRKARSKSHSRSDSLAQTDEEYYDRSKVPPMPMRSELEDSELTRESLLSAETMDSATEKDKFSSSRQIPTPLQSPAAKEVSRSLPMDTAQSRDVLTKKTSRERDTPSNTQTGLASPRSMPSRASLKSEKSERSERSSSQKARNTGLIAAGMGGAAAGLYYKHHKDEKEKSRSRGLSRKASEERDVSPVQTEGSLRGDTRELNVDQHGGVQRADTISSMGDAEPRLRDTRPDTMSSTGEEKNVDRDIHSPASTASVQYPTTQKRHQGVHLEDEEEVFEPHVAPGGQTRDVTTYRDSMQTEDSRGYTADYDSQRNSGALDQTQPRQSFVESLEEHADDDKVYSAQEVRVVSANPQFVNTPGLPHSETGSLMEPSLVGTPQSPITPKNEPFGAQSYKSREQAHEGSGLKNVVLNDEALESRSRWSLLRENAKALSSNSKDTLNSNPQEQTKSRGLPSSFNLGASGIPVANDPMPEIGHGYYEDGDSVTEPSLKERTSSVLHDPLGDPQVNQAGWPYEPTPPAEKTRGEWVPPEDENEPFLRSGNAALMGAAAGLGIAAAAKHDSSGARELQPQHSGPMRAAQSGKIYQDPRFSTSTSKPLTPGNLKDEGYNTADQGEPYSPLRMDRSPPALWGGKIQSRDLAAQEIDDPFTDDDRKSRHLSNNSHGMATGYYDASTGAGINNIQSQDIVALMDHLTVRDGQRSARDTQIVHNLVKSAAESRTNFQDLKALIQVESQRNLKNQNMHGERLLDRIRAGPKPQVLGSPRTPGSADDVPSKKQSLFKRALKGLSSKSSTDVSRIEDMLVQLLGEIETLRATQGGMPLQAQAKSTFAGQGVRTSMDTYDNTQRGPESGYEPEGLAGTGSTPGNSGYFSPPSRNTTRIPPAYNSNRGSEKRVSTVAEESEEDRDLTTPTQEHQRQLSGNLATTPLRGSQESDNLEQSPQTARSSDERKNRRSTFSYPRMSRWSKTTTTSSGTNPRFSTDTNVRVERPESMASQSGEAVNVLPPAGVWHVADDDRLPSATSLAREQNGVSYDVSSPHQDAARGAAHYDDDGYGRGLTPEMLEDPKYTSQRHSITLEHPQPRAGRTERHRTHLESQAHDLDMVDDRASTTSDDQGALFGSVPALGRMPDGSLASHRLSTLHNAAISPLASPRILQATQAFVVGPPRPPKIRDDAPLIPPKIALHAPLHDQHPHGERGYARHRHTQSNTSSHMSDDDDNEGDSMHSIDAGLDPRHLHARGTEDDDLSSVADSADFSYHSGAPVPAADPIERKRSPYIPGGPLAPIEERYSMEIDRNSSIAYSASQRSRRQSFDAVGGHSRGGSAGPGLNSGSAGGGGMLAQVAEESERERSVTPNLVARPALGTVEGGVRKLTGPREMPGEGGSGSLRGTVRRKPVYSGEGGF